MPHLSQLDVEGYVRFAERMGGDKSVHLQWMLAGMGEFVPYGRWITGGVLKAIADLPAGLPHLKRCLTFAALQCPSSRVAPGGLVSWVAGLASELAKLL